MSNLYTKRFAKALLAEYSHEGTFDCTVESQEEAESLVLELVALGCRAEKLQGLLTVRVTCADPGVPMDKGSKEAAGSV
jgi:hypothetical protein